ncbi:MAG: HEAT repeat domain-containing protein [Dehalococcoidia bacterium]|nr:MAG: HEAT repeat domain-containing protein [Dehalococcoidia bacterium]
MKRKRNNILEDTSIPIEQIINDLADNEQPIMNVRLAELSNLNLGQLKTFADIWQDIEVKRQRQIMQRLYELAEDDVCLNFDTIFEYNLRDKDEEVRVTAIMGLWENERVSMIETLINMMNNDNSEKVQSAAALSLGRFSLLAETQVIAKDYAALLGRSLLAVYSDCNRSIDVRRRALEALAPLSLSQVEQAITNAYYDNNPLLKISAIYAMGKNCNPRWLPFLISEASAVDPETRYEVAMACGEIGERQSVIHLIKLTEDDDADVRLASVQALGEIGGGKAKEHLNKCLSHPSEAMRQAAIQALHKLEVITDLPCSQYMDGGEILD